MRDLKLLCVVCSQEQHSFNGDVDQTGKFVQECTLVPQVAASKEDVYCNNSKPQARLRNTRRKHCGYIAQITQACASLMSTCYYKHLRWRWNMFNIASPACSKDDAIALQLKSVSEQPLTCHCGSTSFTMHTISATTNTAKQIRKAGCTKCLVAPLSLAKSSMLLQQRPREAWRSQASTQTPLKRSVTAIELWITEPVSAVRAHDDEGHNRLMSHARARTLTNVNLAEYMLQLLVNEISRSALL
eukprot:1201-Heterococcus_DN1.PRE.2